MFSPFYANCTSDHLTVSHFTIADFLEPASLRSSRIREGHRVTYVPFVMYFRSLIHVYSIDVNAPFGFVILVIGCPWTFDPQFAAGPTSFTVYVVLLFVREVMWMRLCGHSSGWRAVGIGQPRSGLLYTAGASYTVLFKFWTVMGLVGSLVGTI
jgi:hypothetical protein